MNIIEKLGITPGPLEVHEISDPEWTERYIEVRTANKAPIASFNGDNAVWLKGGIDECRANARLFASSHQMLEILIEKVVPYIDPVDTDILVPVLEAIETATPKSLEEIKVLMEDEG